MTRSIPPRADLAKLTQAALFNARDLLSDARALAAAGSADRAHALAVLAFEEVGKANLCTLALGVPGFFTAADFWQAFTSHETKLRWSRGYLELMVRGVPGPVAEAYERLAAICKSDHVRKMGGLYVDYDGGRIAVPGAVDPADADAMISDVQAVLDFQLVAWGDDEAPARILQRLDESAGPLAELFEQVQAAIETDPDATLEVFRAAITASIQATSEQAAIPAEPGDSHADAALS